MAYSKEFREQALGYCHEGYTDDEISEMLGISKNTLGNWNKLLFTTGNLDKKKVSRRSGKPYKYTPEKIKEFLDKSQTPVLPEPIKANNIQEDDKIISREQKSKKKKKYKF